VVNFMVLLSHVLLVMASPQRVLQARLQAVAWNQWLCLVI
jgi:hypothetical protein